MLNRSWPVAVSVRDWGLKLVFTKLVFKGLAFTISSFGKDKKKKTRFQNHLVLWCQRKLSYNNNKNTNKVLSVSPWNSLLKYTSAPASRETRFSLIPFLANSPCGVVTLFLCTKSSKLGTPQWKPGNRTFKMEPFVFRHLLMLPRLKSLSVHIALCHWTLSIKVTSTCSSQKRQSLVQVRWQNAKREQAVQGHHRKLNSSCSLWRLCGALSAGRLLKTANSGRYLHWRWKKDWILACLGAMVVQRVAGCSSHQCLSHLALSLSSYEHWAEEIECLQGGMAIDGTGSGEWLWREGNWEKYCVTITKLIF